MKRVGFLDGRRTRVGGVPIWGAVPNVLIPGTMEAFGIFEEFFGYVLSNAEPSVPGWLCSNQATVLSIADIVGGVVRLTTGVTDNDTGQMQLGDGVGGAFWPAKDKDIWFEARVKQTIEGENTLNLAFGLVDPAAAEILKDDGDGPSTTNHIMFLTLDTDGVGVNAWSIEGAKGPAATDRNVLDENLEATKYHTYGFHVHGHDADGELPGQVDVYYDRALVAAAQILTDYIPVTGLMPFVCIKTGEAHIETVYVDYIMCVQKR